VPINGKLLPHIDLEIINLAERIEDGLLETATDDKVKGDRRNVKIAAGRPTCDYESTEAESQPDIILKAKFRTSESESFLDPLVLSESRNARARP